MHRELNISTVDTYGIKGYSPALTSMVECLYPKVLLPSFGKFFIIENSIFPEFFIQQATNISLNCVYRDYIEKILMVSQSPLDQNYPEYHKEIFNFDSYPVAILDINSLPKGSEKSLVITYGDFKYYLMKGEDEPIITEIEPPSDLKQKFFITLNYRRERNSEGRMISHPLIVKMLATSGWNHFDLAKFESIAPFDTKNSNNDVIYKSQNFESIYKTRIPLMMFETPITYRSGEIVETKYLPIDIKVILENKSKKSYPCTTLLKVQNFYPKNEKKKIIKFIKLVFKTCITLCINTLSSIPVGTEYKDDKALPAKYKNLLRFLYLHHELTVNNKYDLAVNSIIEQDHLNIAIKDLEDLYKEVDQI